MSEILDEFHQRRQTIRTEMGGTDKVERIHRQGRATVREHIDRLVDHGSFEEVGTFSRSANPEDRDTPGDGKIGGHARLDGRPVTVFGDDVTVRRASSSVVGSRKIDRLIDHALHAGNPIVHFGQTGGARIPDTLGTEGFLEVVPKSSTSHRARRVPMVTAIVGESFGGSSFLSAHSDFVVQVRGTCLAVTSPRVIEIATSEQIGFEELGGVDVHARLTGQIDAVAETDDEAYELIKRFLSFLPSNSWTPPAPPQRDPAVREPDPELVALVPEARRRGYDMRSVLRRLLDGGDFLEIRPLMGRSLLCALGRLDGQAVGVIASQPMQQAGVLGPDACDKATKLICLCDAFGLPLIFLQDVPGFLVGKNVEHQRLLHKAIMFQQALHLAQVPKLTVVLRKAFGLAYFSLGGTGQGADLVCAWPGAEIGFMDPDVGASVLYGTQLQHLEREERVAELRRRADALRNATDPYGGAGSLRIDEIIDPADTRAVLARYLDRFAGRPFQPGHLRPLASWPTCW